MILHFTTRGIHHLMICGVVQLREAVVQSCQNLESRGLRTQYLAEIFPTPRYLLTRIGEGTKAI